MIGVCRCCCQAFQLTPDVYACCSKPMQDELLPLKKDKIKGKVSADCVTDAQAARAWAQTLVAGMDKPDADAIQALCRNMF